MGIEMKLQFKLQQQLTMTPQLAQAIRLLQLSRADLIEEVHQELEKNPCLADEITEPRTRLETDKSMPQSGVGELPPEERIGVTERAERETDMAGREMEKQVKEVDWDQFLENRQMQTPSGAGSRNFDELPPIEQSLTKPNNLRDHLLWQLQMSDFVEHERQFALLVIGNLDERGYLDLTFADDREGKPRPPITLLDLAEEAGLHPDDAEEVLSLIQRFDPVGVAARDLRECLLIQAEVLGYDEGEKTIIREHLHLVERRNFGAIAKSLKIPLEEVYESVQEIQKLESVPARNFMDVDEKTLAITPDVYVTKDGDKWEISDNDKGIQRLYINEALAQQMLRDPKAKQFISEKLKDAQWLIRAIEQRRRTIIRVTECIVEKQREFFDKGVAYLRPMILRDIADTLGMHESTISRATAQKYVHTPQGIFELKYFFNSSISRVADEDIASESVKQSIRKIIAAEDKGNPLSDQAIVQMLEDNDGVKIARRTVAKYREMLGILSSSKRKKMF